MCDIESSRLYIKTCDIRAEPSVWILLDRNLLKHKPNLLIERDIRTFDCFVF